MPINAHLLYQPAYWSNPSQVHRLFAQMRAEDPVHHCLHPDYPDFWHVTRHADIFEVERRTDKFLNEPRLIINTRAREMAIRHLTGGSTNLIRSLVTMDPPEHPKMRLLTQAWFMPKNLARLQSEISQSVEVAMAQLVARGGECDFAKDIAVEYPLRVIMAVLGVPASDYSHMLRLTQELFGPDDPDTKRKDVEPSADPAAALRKTFQEFADYFDRLTEEKRARPTEDVASVIANAQIDGKPIDRAAALGYYIIVATAGHDTTSYSLSEAIAQLAVDPELLAKLKRDPATIGPKVVEEAIRMAAPVRHFVRTAREDVKLNGKVVRAGESVILWYPSGCRDEAVFSNPDRFDIDRDQTVRHAAFGHGAHMCLGMHLARQENVAFLQAFADCVERLDLPVPPDYIQANFVGGMKRLQIRAELAS